MFRAIKYTKTAVDNSATWESSKVLAAIPNSAKADTLSQEFAMVDADADQDQRNSYKLPHHLVDEDGNVGAASVAACQAAIAYLDKQGKADGMSDEAIAMAYQHLKGHLADAGIEASQLNAIPDKTHHVERLRIDNNSFEDDQQGTLTFPAGQIVMDDQELKSGLRYDIASMNVDEYNGTVTADHDRRLQSIIAKTKLFKRGNQVVMTQMQFAINENPFAQVAYDLYRNGFAKDFSIETYGPWPGPDGVFADSTVSGMSGVVVGNSRPATMNAIANSLAAAKANNLDVAEVEEQFGVKAAEISTNSHKDTDMTYKTVKNGQTFTVKVAYKNAAGEDVQNELAAGASIDVAEDQAAAVENQIQTATDPADKPITANDLQSVVDKALEDREAKHAQAIEDLKKQITDNAAQEPTWRPNNRTQRNAGGKLAEMDWKERTALQLKSLNASFKGDGEAGRVATEINRINLENLQEAGIASNALDLPDLGNFVIPKEMVTEIKEQVSNYTPLLNLFNFEETLSLQTAWLTGTGEIQMEDVDMDDNGDDGDLKPVKKPSFDTDLVTLKEFAAVTPVKQSAIRFAAVDVVGHLTRLYRRAYDKTLAESIIGRLQQAVDTNGNTVAYNYSSAAGGNVEALVSLITAWSEVAEFSPNGTYLMTQKSYAHLFAMALRAGTNGPLANLFSTGPNALPLFLGRPYVIVPSTLMPSLNTADTKSISFEGDTVTVDSGVLYADPSDFVGRVSGGLNFQVSDVASYEEDSKTKSAFQRDELVFRGYGFRASGLYFPENVSAVSAPGIS